jgi:hypothetical protein
VLDSIRGRYLGRLKVPIRRRRETKQVRVHTRVRPCGSVHRLPHDKARRWSMSTQTGVVEANVLVVDLASSACPRRSDITRAGVSGAPMRPILPPDFFWE